MSVHPNKKMLLLSVTAGISFWFLDAVMDYYFKHEGRDFLSVLIYDAPTHEFFIRPLFFVFFIAFGLVFCAISKRSKESSTRYERLFENIQDAILVISANGDGKLSIIDANKLACSIFGYERDELMRLSLADMIHADELPGFIAGMSLSIQEDSCSRFEARLLKKDGGEIFAEVNITQCNVDGKAAYLAVIRDITGKRKTENELMKSEQQLRVLTSRLLDAQENERRRISVGLHDELGQALMHLKFRVGSLVKKCQETSPGSQSDFGPVLPYMDEIIEYVRRLSRDLSPTVLEELGLTSALQYLVEEFSEHYNIGWETVSLDEIDDLFGQQAQIGIFRIVQELLTNVVRHSKAGKMSVVVRRLDGSVSFMVEDNGIGFEVEKALSEAGSQEGIGLPSMQERVRMIGGWLNIWSEKGAGTRVTFVVPVEMRDEQSVAV